MADNIKNQDSQTLEQIEVESISKQRNILQGLYATWNKVGLQEAVKANRVKEVWGHVFHLLEEILEEEKGLYEEIKTRMTEYEEQIKSLLIELDLPQKIEISGTLALYEKEFSLREQLDKLKNMKHKRLKEYNVLKEQERKLCEILGKLQLKLSSATGVPTEKDIFELRQHVIMLEDEKERRQKKIFMLKKELTTIIEVTELTPESDFEKEILTSKEDSLSLTQETFKRLEEAVNKTKIKIADLENEKAVLMDKLSILWNVLKIDKAERESFLAKYNDCRISCLKAIKEEVERCEHIKKQNIEKYVISLKEELLSLLEKCFISQSEKKLSFLQDGEINETTLEAYDNEVAKWRKYYKETEHIIQKIQKRQELWHLMLTFENKATDKNRFKNRGGNLLREERQRNKLQKDLPALEQEIFLDIEKYEEESGKHFLYFGEDFRHFITRQWEDRLIQKENEKIMRQKLRTKQLEGERTGITPSKRTLLATPKSAPSKLFKSTLGVPIYKTPNFSVSKPVPNTVNRIKTRRMSKLQSSAIKNSEQNVLKELNGNAPSGSDCLDSTTYTQFADKLNRSSRCRSSVLCSRKIGGTRISINKRKSVNKSIKKKNSTNITPARGKLGLPFLI